MADKKISALPAASTPLAGTEVLPIVQGGTTDQVSVANLTAGRAVSALSLATPDTDAATSITASGLSVGRGAAFVGGQTELFTVGARRLGIGTTGATSLHFYSGSAEAFRVDTNQNLVISTAGKGIDFSANTHAAGMTSELLNDYEEGTWTPTDASGAGLTFTVNFAKYTKVGNLVTANGFITFPSTANSSVATISLPYVAANSVVGSAGSDSTSNAVNILIDGGFAQFTVRNNQLGTLTNANLSGLFLFFSVTYQV